MLGSFAGLQRLSAPVTPPPAVIYKHIKLFVRKTCLIFSRLCLNFWNNFNRNKFKDNAAKTATKIQKSRIQPIWNSESTLSMEYRIHGNPNCSRVITVISRGVTLFSWGEQTIIHIYFDCFEEPFHSFYSHILYSPVKTLKGWVKVR